jgi:hypothetical protein
MNTHQQQQHDEVDDLTRRYHWLRELFVAQRERFIDYVQAASRDIEEVDAHLLRLHEELRDLAAEVDRTEGVA